MDGQGRPRPGCAADRIARLARSADPDEAELMGDPRWVVLQRELDAFDKEKARAVAALIRAEPSTAAGAATLTRHVVSFATGATSGRVK